MNVRELIEIGALTIENTSTGVSVSVQGMTGPASTIIGKDDAIDIIRTLMKLHRIHVNVIIDKLAND